MFRYLLWTYNYSQFKFCQTMFKCSFRVFLIFHFYCKKLTEVFESIHNKTNGLRNNKTLYYLQTLHLFLQLNLLSWLYSLMRECCPLIRNVTKPYLILLIMGDFNYSNHDMAIFHLLHSYVALCTFTHGCGPVGPTKSYHIRFS